LLFCFNKQRRFTINTKQEYNMKEQKKGWSLSLGFYPGILFGIRSYNETNQNETNQTTHVLYVPFIDVALEIYN